MWGSCGLISSRANREADKQEDRKAELTPDLAPSETNSEPPTMNMATAKLYNAFIITSMRTTVRKKNTADLRKYAVSLNIFRLLLLYWLHTHTCWTSFCGHLIAMINLCLCFLVCLPSFVSLYPLFTCQEGKSLTYGWICHPEAFYSWIGPAS